MKTPFEDVRILDFTRFLAGPFGTHQFALQGADVLKIESLDGDETRSASLDPRLSSKKMSAGFMAVNPNKRSMALDLRKPEAVEIVKKLVRDADVVWENFRPGVMKKLGLDYETLSKINPRLIYCSISGFGHSGPEQYTAAFDGKIQAMSGIMSITGDPEGGPMRAGFAVCDLIGGITSAFAVASALYQRKSTGKGQFIDVAMLDSTLSFLGIHVAEYTFLGHKQRQLGNLSVSRKPTTHRFKAGDGDIVLAVMTERQFANLMKTLDRPDVLSDPRFKDWFTRREHAAELREIIEGAMASETPAYWEKTLTAADVPCATVYAIDEIVHHPQLKHRTLLQTVESPFGPQTLAGCGFELEHSAHGIKRAAPMLGEHTDEALRSVGYTDAEIDALRASGIVGARPAAAADSN